MAITYTWEFPALDIAYADESGFSNVVRTVHWRLTAEEDGVSSDSYGTVKLPQARMPFTNFEALTHGIVERWVETTLGEQLDQIKSNLATALAQKKTPIIAEVSPPWA